MIGGRRFGLGACGLCRADSCRRRWARTFAGTVVPMLQNLKTSPELRQNIKEATFLTAKTTAMVCWLFIGSALFSAVFALHGGQSLIERWVLSMNLSPLGFQFTAQMIIFLLGWPLEWTEIIVIFCPIFIPLLEPLSDRPDSLRHHGRGAICRRRSCRRRWRCRLSI